MLRHRSFVFVGAIAAVSLGLTSGCSNTMDPCSGNPCDDGLACNGPEICTWDGIQGFCSPGFSVQCSLGMICLEPTGACGIDPDANRCLGVLCDDRDACTVDSCQFATGLCRYAPVECQAGETCIDGECVIDDLCVFVDCDDNDACTDDSCLRGECINRTIDCDDGVYCNGVETCRDGLCMDGIPVECLAGETCENGACVSHGCPFTRSFLITPPPPVEQRMVYGVVDYPPAGWTVSDINENGKYDGTNHAVKWLFIPVRYDIWQVPPKTLRYTATSPAAAGKQCFNGTVNYNGEQEETIPSQCFSCD